MNASMPDMPSIEDHAALLHRHLISISETIARTRQEIAELHQEQEAGRACDELNAVVQGTEHATNTILTASETVDTLARRLARNTQDQATKDDAEAIQAQMQTIFEACNFQDLTGQRISKVVRTVGFVEERVAEMLRLWSGSVASGAQATSTRSKPTRHADQDGLLNGPALPGTAAVSQDAVDALFD